MTTRTDFVNLALNQVGCWCYVWGGNGQDMSAMDDAAREDWIKCRESDSKNQIRVRTLYNKLAEAGIRPIRGGDCSGFVYWCLKTLNSWKSDTNANGFYNATKRISYNDLMPGDLAFRISSGKATHVGIYVGNDYFVHSKGRDVGVVRERSSHNYWDDYGVLSTITNDTVNVNCEVDTANCEAEYAKCVKFSGNVYLRSEPSILSSQLKVMRSGDTLPLCDSCIYDERGCEWYAVLYNDRIAYCSAFTGKKRKYTEVIATNSKERDLE